MNKFILVIMALTLFGFVQAQDIAQREVPSIVVNNFKSQFPKAYDIEWKKDGDRYQVDFEMHWNLDHKVWYDAFGNQVKKIVEIDKKNLPPAIVSRISTDFKEYGIEGAKKIITEGETQYVVKIDSYMKQDWKVIMDSKGNILNQITD